MNAYTLSTKEIEDIADLVKVAVLRNLVNDRLLDEKSADKWAANHTIIARKKTIFRTISNLWSKAEEISGLNFLVVGFPRLHPPQEPT